MSTTGPKHGNVDALGRLPRASDLDKLDDKENVEQIVYANVLSRQPTSAPAPLLASKRDASYQRLSPAHDSQESISVHLPCELCGAEFNWEGMLICDGRGLGYHMGCLQLRINQVPEWKWYCGSCKGDGQVTPAYLDILDDVETLKLLRHPDILQEYGEQQKKRVMKRGKNYTRHVDEAGNAAVMRKPVGAFQACRVPKLGEREAIVQRYHELGHFGVLRTSKLVAQDFYWGGIIQTVKDYVSAKCFPCRMQRARVHEAPEMISVDVPFSCVCIDLVGPLPVSASGNRFIVNAVDYLTKWPESKAIPNKEAGTILDFFMEFVVARHGCPDEVLTDNGGESLGIFDDALQEMGIDPYRTSANHPEANGLVEHFNETTFMDALRKCMADDPEFKTNWDKFMPMCCWGIG